MLRYAMPVGLAISHLQLHSLIHTRKYVSTHRRSIEVPPLPDARRVKNKLISPLSCFFSCDKFEPVPNRSGVLV